jgi:hypothetical protein
MLTQWESLDIIILRVKENLNKGERKWKPIKHKLKTS